jgi:hypothetical protein
MTAYRQDTAGKPLHYIEIKGLWAGFLARLIGFYESLIKFYASLRGFYELLIKLYE